jgi:hypothetical protein
MSQSLLVFSDQKIRAVMTMITIMIIIIAMITVVHAAVTMIVRVTAERKERGN